MKKLQPYLSMFHPARLATRLSVYAPLPIRFIVGYGFIAHSYAKIIENPENFAAILHSLNVPAPHFMAWATIAIELLGGLAVLLGAFVPLIAWPMLAMLLVAALTVHLPFGFTSIKLMTMVNGVPQFGPPGYETRPTRSTSRDSQAWLCAGSGPFAVDAWLKPLYDRCTA
ncbi:Membrane protein, distant similarity to thiosulfate:quinone oxidoreductase DoxD [Candidatus Paraburkholderia calva]|nr:Membrane protein, distant similarity to thiosulfate:quinone oxidoreductase DoxD [Candidatus Paraburkholderia calva]